MRRTATSALAGTALSLALAGCGSEQAGTQQVTPSSRTAAPPQGFIKLSRPDEDAKIPNPGTGTAEPRLAAALLTRFRAERSSAPVAVPTLPAAAVRFPVRDTKSQFIGLRQISSPFTGAAACTKWTSGMWAALISDYNTTPGVQMGVSRLATPPHPLGPEDLTPEGRAKRQRLESLTFSEAIITGPPHVLDTLADGRTPGACLQLTMYGGAPGRIEPLPTPEVGDQSWAYRILDSKGYVWHWVQVTRHRSYLIEIRIPNQGPGPRVGMVSILHQAAEQAYTKATRTLT